MPTYTLTDKRLGFWGDNQFVAVTISLRGEKGALDGMEAVIDDALEGLLATSESMYAKVAPQLPLRVIEDGESGEAETPTPIQAARTRRKRTGVEVPADGTMSPEISNPPKRKSRAKAAAPEA